MRGLFLIALLLAAMPARADDAATGHISATVVDATTIPECGPGVTGECLPVVVVPDCPAGHYDLDCIPSG